VKQLSPAGNGWRSDRVADEEPLELRVQGRPLTMTMRSPGNDFDLAVGFLFSEGLIDSADQIRSMRACARDDERRNLLDIVLRSDAPGYGDFTPRAFLTSSACGVCGSATIDAVMSGLQHNVANDPLHLRADVLSTLPERLREAQRAFASTGGLHAAGIFDSDGNLIIAREDVGRHNAVDKVVGWAATRKLLPLEGRILLVSGRASFELTQKAVVAGIPMLAAVSAPSSLAVELAQRSGMTLVGFLRGDTFNVYARHDRVAER
jgi:FdhD protein